MSEISFKKAWSVTKTEYIKWICDGRMVFLLMLWVFIKECVTQPLLERATEMNQPVNFMEPFLAVGNSGIMVLILPLVYLALIADFPRIDGNTILILQRVGRKNWLIGQILFAICSFHSFLLGVLLGSILPVASKSFVYDGWSLVVTDYESLHPETVGSYASELIPKNLYNQISPYRAALWTYLLLSAYMMTLALLMLLFQIQKKKVFGFFLCGAVITLGSAFCAINSMPKWIFPMAHSIVWIHYNDYYRKMLMPFRYSVFYFVIVGGTLLVSCFVLIRKMNFDVIQEVD